jgi:hypothetical protein
VILCRLALVFHLLFLCYNFVFPADSQNFLRMADEDGDLAEKEWASDLPGPEDERDRAAGEEVNPDAAPKPAGSKVSPPRRTLQPICRMTTRSWF